MKVRHYKLANQSTGKLSIGAALWDGVSYPFKKPKLVRSSLFLFIYILSIYYFSYLLAYVAYLTACFVYELVCSIARSIAPYSQLAIQTFIYDIIMNPYFYDRPENILSIVNFRNTVFLRFENIIDYLLFAPIYGYCISIVQQSLKDNNTPPKFSNFKRLFTMGIKVSILFIMLGIAPQYLFKFVSFVLYPIGLGEFVFQAANSTQWVEMGYLGRIPVQLVIYPNLMIACTWIVIPAILISYSSRGRLSDLLPLNQYKEIFKSLNYIRLVLLTFAVMYFPKYLVIVYNLTGSNYDVTWYYFVVFPILKGSLFIYMLIVMSRILGKQWKKISQSHGNRRLICDTTVQKKLDSYFKK